MANARLDKVKKNVAALKKETGAKVKQNLEDEAIPTTDDLEAEAAGLDRYLHDFDPKPTGKRLENIVRDKSEGTAVPVQETNGIKTCIKEYLCCCFFGKSKSTTPAAKTPLLREPAPQMIL